MFFIYFIVIFTPFGYCFLVTLYDKND